MALLRWTYVRRHVPSGRLWELTTEPMREVDFLRLLLRWNRQRPDLWQYHEGGISTPHHLNQGRK